MTPFNARRFGGSEGAGRSVSQPTSKPALGSPEETAAPMGWRLSPGAQHPGEHPSLQHSPAIRAGPGTLRTAL